MDNLCPRSRQEGAEGSSMIVGCPLEFVQYKAQAVEHLRGLPRSARHLDLLGRESLLLGQHNLGATPLLVVVIQLALVNGLALLGARTPSAGEGAHSCQEVIKLEESWCDCHSISNIASISFVAIGGTKVASPFSLARSLKRSCM